jgi:hypothetical protein
MCELFDTHRIPTAFVAESLQGISQSFSVQTDAESTTVFFHLLVKDVAISDGRIIHVEGPQETANDLPPQSQSQSQANFTWLKSGFVLKIRNESNLTQPPSRTASSSSESTLSPASTPPKVDMFCFGAPVALRDRFQKLKRNASCEDILLDPYVLLEMVLHEMYKVMDQTGWAIANIFGKIETASHSNSRYCSPSSRSDKYLANLGNGKDPRESNEATPRLPGAS